MLVLKQMNPTQQHLQLQLPLLVLVQKPISGCLTTLKFQVQLVRLTRLQQLLLETMAMRTDAELVHHRVLLK